MNRKLDVLVEKRIMGNACYVVDDYAYIATGNPLLPPTGDASYATPVPAYSSDIAAAWQVVEKMTERWIFYLNCAWMTNWTCELIHRSPWDLPDDMNDEFHGSGVTAPLAICLAALYAVDVGNDEIQEALSDDQDQ